MSGRIRPLQTDSGIDLVAFSPRRHDAITIHVKANLEPKPSGGRGKLLLHWRVRNDSPADLLAFVDLQSGGGWLVKIDELQGLAQQHPEGRFHFFLATGPTASKRRDGKPVHDYEFQKYLLENRVHQLF